MFGSALAGEPVDDRAVYQLPEDHTDFVFIILLERFGWLGAIAVLGVAGALVWQALTIAANTREPSGRLIAIGLAVVGTFIILKICDTVVGVRASEDEEIEGLDLSMHGEEGYNFEA